MKRLIDAIDHDNLIQIKALLQEGIDLSTPVIIGQEYELDEPDETSILFYAIRNRADIEVIELLLEHGADIQSCDENGVSTLDTAIKFKRHDMITLCIDKGFDINDSQRKSGIRPLMLAACFGDTQTAQLLLDKGADINATDKSGMSPKDYARKLGQKKMLTFLTEHGGKYSAYRDEE